MIDITIETCIGDLGYLLNLPLWKYIYSTNQTVDTMSLNRFVICVKDDIPHIGIFLTFSSSHFYVRFGHEHAPGSTRV